MTKENNLKSLSIEVSKECWKKLKIGSIQKDLSLKDYVREVLERVMSQKSLEVDIN